MIVYDQTLVSHIREALFEPASWPDAKVVPGTAGGRGKTLVINVDQEQWVLRHYYRGGMAGRLLSDQYLWLGSRRTRSFSEWLLLERLSEMGLPVPRPVAGRFIRQGPIYTADLITVRIPGVVPLSTRLSSGSISSDAWREIGRMIGRFHAADIFHADLNAHNVQIDDQERCFLLDFDRGRIRSARGTWTTKNLLRLHRSLTKISRDSAIEFSGHEWDCLLDGYRAATDG